MTDGPVFVTGATGFIGRRLCDRLSGGGGDVRRGERRTGVPDWSAELAGCNALVHLAYPLPHESLLALLRAAADGDVRRVVLMSSVKAMAESTPPGVALTETDEPRPATAYGHRKLVVEGLARQEAEGGYELVVLRPPVVHGPGARGGLARLASAVLRGWPLPLGGVDNARSLVGLDNLCDAVDACLSADAAAGRTFLVADGPPVSTPQLIALLAAAAGRRARLLPIPSGLLRAAGAALGQRGNVRRLLDSLAVDDSAIRAALGWRPALGLAEGLGAMVRGRPRR